MTELQKDIAELYEAIRSVFSGDYEVVDFDKIALVLEKHGLTLTEEGAIETWEDDK